ncbi:metallophosphoesterase [Thiomicrorhabdus indica]|uniref:metallophosphoesterase n=1 Tax=Thiomicrorhabdus indica TaxID=2267253 RepID=UPI002AA74ABD|nr:metallophosphoesterase [Thiomicrorhabdus indica]
MTTHTLQNDENIENFQNWIPESAQDFELEHLIKPNKKAYFFCDLHADANAFLRSLKLSQLIHTQSNLQNITLTENAKTSQIIIGGDCFDKGPSNLELFQLLARLRETGIDLVLLAGNHDIRVLAGMIALEHTDDMRQVHFIVRMGRKTVAFFKEVFDYYQLNLHPCPVTNVQAIEKLTPPQQWFDSFAEFSKNTLNEKQLAKEFKQIRKKQRDIFDACFELGMEPKHLYQAIKFAQQLFIEPAGEFAWFFQELKLLHRSGNYLFCHAGLDDEIAELFSELRDPCDELNNVFQQTLMAGKIFEIYYSSYGNVVRTKYRDKNFAFTRKGAKALKEQGIYAIVNGHRSHTDGQKLYLREGILNFECDTELNQNCRAKRGLNTFGESVTIFSLDGSVNALCNDLPAPKQFRPSVQSA